MQAHPIETLYAGYRFRSRLEARWAVFFDTLGIRWEYEPEGFVLGGRPYLPDFLLHLPGGPQAYAEVKRDGVDDYEGEHVWLLRQLARQTGIPCVLLVGAPAYRIYNVFHKDLAADKYAACFFHSWVTGPSLQELDTYWWQQLMLGDGGMEFPFDDRRAGKAWGDRLVEAVKAAKQARFEHGERPRGGIRLRRR
jgi:hypothetical protein